MPLVATGRCGACLSMISGKSSCRPSTLSRSGSIPGSGMTSWICSSCFSPLLCFSVSERPLPLYWGFGRWLFQESSECKNTRRDSKAGRRRFPNTRNTDSPQGLLRHIAEVQVENKITSASCSLAVNEEYKDAWQLSAVRIAGWYLLGVSSVGTLTQTRSPSSLLVVLSLVLLGLSYLG